MKAATMEKVYHLVLEDARKVNDGWYFKMLSLDQARSRELGNDWFRSSKGATSSSGWDTAAGQKTALRFKTSISTQTRLR